MDSSLSRFERRSFLIGAGISCALTLVTQVLWNQRRKQQRATETDNRIVQQPDRQSSNDTTPVIMDSPDLDLRLIRKAEAVIRLRTSSITVVVERCTNDHNYSAILRTAEALGIQNVWIIDPPIMTDGAGNYETDTAPSERPKQQQQGIVNNLTPAEVAERRLHRLFAQNATEWLTVVDFETTSDCLNALKETNHTIWVTDLSQQAVPLVASELARHEGCWPLPPKLAIVMGTEAVGCSQEMLNAADRRIYLPLRGFADSLNLSVATALVIHQIFALEPTYAGNMSEEERRELRKQWFSKLARQRLLSSRDKKTRRELLKKVNQADRIQAKKDSGQELTPDQEKKLRELPEAQQALTDLEASKNYSTPAVEQAVADLVASPPEPLSDLRRADLHRVTFVGKNTKRQNNKHWKDMPATDKTPTPFMSTSSFFRERVDAITTSK